jgi:hypothetical protein
VIGDKLAKTVVGVVVAVWAITTVVLPVAIRGYTPPPEVGTVMGIVAGGAVAVIFARSRNGNGSQTGRAATMGTRESGAGVLAWCRCSRRSGCSRSVEPFPTGLALPLEPALLGEPAARADAVPRRRDHRPASYTMLKSIRAEAR